MIVREIVVTCSNPHVAHAAVGSIGGELARRFTDEAARRNLPSGVLAGRLIRRFTLRATDGEWDGVNEATRGADQPILSGLRYILERGLDWEEEEAEPPRGWRIFARPRFGDETWRPSPP